MLQHQESMMYEMNFLNAIKQIFSGTEKLGIFRIREERKFPSSVVKFRKTFSLTTSRLEFVRIPLSALFLLSLIQSENIIFY